MLQCYGTKLILLIGLILSAHKVGGQIGVTTCNCQPSTFTFVLDFSLDCSDNEIVEGPGISGDACFVQGETNGTETPVSVTFFDIQETSSDGLTIRRQTFNGPFNEGDNFTYVAFTAANTSDVTNSTNPESLQVTAVGVNAANETLIGLWRANFINDCDTFPVIANDANALWVTLVS